MLLSRLLGRQRPAAPAPAPEPPPATTTPTASHWLHLYPGHDDGELAILHRHARHDLAAEPDYLVDFIGTRTHCDVLWHAVRHLSGSVAGLPVPADHHAETIEWVGLLKCVESCRSRFVAMELGAGWGPWIVAGGVAARNAGIGDIRLTGVEADPGRFALMLRHLADNGFDPDAHTLLQAAVGAESGHAHWPALDEPTEGGGARPTREGNAADIAYSGGQAGGIDVEIVAFRDLLGREQVWDLVHIDIQGWEAEVCESARDMLCERVRWLIVGTHSRALDGRMIEIMWSLGWRLENEKPTMFTHRPDAASLEMMTTVDGSQVWRNPALE